MQVTLIETRETLDVYRKLADGSEELVGSYGISIADPTFVARSEEFVKRVEAAGYKNPEQDYRALAEECAGLLRAAFEDPGRVDEALGGRNDFFNTLLLLTAVMGVVNALDPTAQMMERLSSMLPDGKQLSAEALASRR